MLSFSCCCLQSLQGSMLGSFLFGVFGWLIGSLGHDAGHFSASRCSLVNDIGVWGMSLLCNPIMWQHQHTYAHHSHTNEFDHDPDLHHFHLLLRVHRRVQQDDNYKNQRYWPFVMFAYSFVVFGTCLWIPLDLLKTGFLYGIVEFTDRHRPLRAFGMIAHMMGYVTIIMFVPFLTSSSWYKALASVILHISTSGFLFGIFSQINHLSEGMFHIIMLAADGGQFLYLYLMFLLPQNVLRLMRRPEKNPSGRKCSRIHGRQRKWRHRITLLQTHICGTFFPMV